MLATVNSTTIRRVTCPVRRLAGPLLLLALGCLTGCVTTRTPRCQLAVGNAGTQTVHDVELVLGPQAQPYRTAVVPAQGEVYFPPTPALASRRATLVWKDAAGVAHSSTLDVTQPMRRDFRGRVYFQIDAAQATQVFVQPDRDKGEPVMPWGRPEKWEGTIGLPGLTPDE